MIEFAVQSQSCFWNLWQENRVLLNEVDEITNLIQMNKSPRVSLNAFYKTQNRNYGDFLYRIYTFKKVIRKFMCA